MLANKILIIINFILPLLACFRMLQCMYLSRVMQSRLELGQRKLEDAGLLYLISEDKLLLQRMVRLVMLAILLLNVMAAYFSYDRMMHGFAPYATPNIKALAVIFHLLMLLVAQGIFMIYNQSNLSFLKRFKL